MIQSIERAMLVINILAKHPKRFFTVQEIFNETDLLLAQYTDYYIH